MVELSKWQLVKEFVNANEFFDKKLMRTTLNIKESSNYTESQYVSYMLSVGFVKRIGRGKYQRIIKIPKNVSSTLIYKLSYSDREFTTKYMKKLIRKQKLENLYENNK